MTMASKTNQEVLSQEQKIMLVQGVIRLLCLTMCRTLAVRVTSVILFVVGTPADTVANLVGCCSRTAKDLLKKLQVVSNAEEVDAILTVHFCGNRAPREGEVRSYVDNIVSIVEKGTFGTLRQIADTLKKELKITVPLSSLSRFMKEHGIKKYKCGSLPAKADFVKQRMYYDNTMSTLLEKALNNEVVCLFLDASHFVIGSDFLPSIWGRQRVHLKTMSGRMRYNVLGAIDYVTKKIWTVTNDSYITSTEVMEMLHQLHDAYKGKEIHIFLDNAAYQRAKVVQALALELGIHLEFIPSYSPNLNLIERIWRFVRGELRVKHYDDFTEFKTKIDDIIASSTTTNKEKLATLINGKIQLFDDLESENGQVYKRNKRSA